MIDSGKDERRRVVESLPPFTETDTWKALPKDQQPIQCERFDICGDDAKWTVPQANVFVCDYHRFIFEILKVVHSGRIKDVA